MQGDALSIDMERASFAKASRIPRWLWQMINTGLFLSHLQELTHVLHQAD
jgi:hypothetical protein